MWTGLIDHRTDARQSPSPRGSSKITNRSGRRRGFTLIELLVVISIIALLIGILLPVLGNARDTSELVSCLGNTRQMALATNAYLVDHNQYTPAATSNNATGNSPRSRGQVAGTNTDGNGPYNNAGDVVWNSIGGALAKYLEGDAERIYRCPSAEGTRDDGWKYLGTDPLFGTAAPNEFRPNYYYFSTTGLLASANPVFSSVFGMRNIANINADAISNQSISEVVVFVEESTGQHTGSEDIYTREAAGRKEVDLDNFAYLDGHAATVKFENLHGYLTALHKAIPQTQWGINFETSANWAQRDSAIPADF